MRFADIKLADKVGFEPTERLHARQFSRLLLSTTQPPVLVYLVIVIQAISLIENCQEIYFSWKDCCAHTLIHLSQFIWYIIFNNLRKLKNYMISIIIIEIVQGVKHFLNTHQMVEGVGFEPTYANAGRFTVCCH